MKKAVSLAKRYPDLLPFIALLRKDDVNETDSADVSGTVKFRTLKESVENKIQGFEQNLRKIEEDIRLADNFHEVVELSRAVNKFTKKKVKKIHLFHLRVKVKILKKILNDLQKIFQQN